MLRYEALHKKRLYPVYCGPPCLLKMIYRVAYVGDVTNNGKPYNVEPGPRLRLHADAKDACVRVEKSFALTRGSLIII
jgi:hypothetical protein